MREEERGSQAASRFTHHVSRSLGLGIILVAYGVIAAQYAARTPAWQAPDEPAHYNYVRYVAETGTLPVLRPGDYDQKFNEQFTNPKNTPNLPIEPMRYQSWQPPLYYLLAAPVFALTGGSLLALRLFSVALGGVLIVAAFCVVREVKPNRPDLALGTAAFVAFVPQHVAMMAAVNNDSLAELLLALTLLQAFRVLTPVVTTSVVTQATEVAPTGHFERPSENPPPTPAAARRGQGHQGTKKSLEILGVLVPWWSIQRPSQTGPQMDSKASTWAQAGGLLVLGVLLGLGLLTKGTNYLIVPIVFIALLLRIAYRPSPVTDRVPTFILQPSAFILVFVPALALGALWWLRNLSVYGGFDILGLARHNAVVVGQPLTSDWIARLGLGPFLTSALTTTFHSFWGQFGWMGVPMPDDVYLALGALCLVALAGWLWSLRPNPIGQGASSQPTISLSHYLTTSLSHYRTIALTLLVLFTFGYYVFYNLTFVQHQGRYLFPALIPLGLVFSLGVDRWSRRLPRPLGLAAYIGVFAALAALDVYALYRFIIPSLVL